jgi:peptidoglycan hydrolase-like protein with peptidoglycan-binding domain
VLAAIAPSFVMAASLTRQLEVGMSGNDVSTLQTFLAQDSTIYPQGLVTGYFGFLTKSAVSNFQSRNGISAIGRVGPITLAALNAQMAGGSADIDAPTIFNVSVGTSNNSANVYWNTSESAKGIVYYSNNPLVTTEHATYVDVSGSLASTDTSLRSSQNVLIQGLQSNTTYYYLIYSTDASGNVSVTLPTTFRTQS